MNKGLLKCHPDKCKHRIIGKTIVGSIEYCMTINNTTHPLDTIEKAETLKGHCRNKAVF